MNITMLGLGSRGDVQMLTALGKQLSKSGYTIKLVAGEKSAHLVNNTDIQFVSFNTNQSKTSLAQSEKRRVTKAAKPNLVRFYNANGPRIFDTCWEGSQTADAIIGSPLATMCAPHIAEKLDIPVIGAWAALGHYPTRAFPSTFLPIYRDLGNTLNLMSYYMGGTAAWWLHRSTINRWRKERLNLPPLGLDYPWHYQRTRAPLLYGFSSHLIPRPLEWDDRVHITGFWFLDRDEWRPSPELVDFLEKGPPPVYIGFGSMSHYRAKENIQIALQALNKIGQRGILVTTWDGITNVDLPDHVFKVDSIPHDWLFPRVAVAVHHGGPGTLGAALRAGIPSVCVPFHIDQFLCGRRNYELGVGPAPIPRKKLSVEKLASAIELATRDAQMKIRVKELSQKICTEDGVANAVHIIDDYLQKQA